MCVATIFAMTLAAAGVGQIGYGSCPTCGNTAYAGGAPVMYGSPVAPVGTSAVPVATVMPYAGLSYGSGSGAEQLFPYDSPNPWMHGYIQHVPAYGGFRYFRPYNYKHVLAQSSTAGQWGMPPSMPYSQQFWHRYQDRASLTPPPQTTNSQADFATQYARGLAYLKTSTPYFQPTAATLPSHRTDGGFSSAHPARSVSQVSQAEYMPSSAGRMQPLSSIGRDSVYADRPVYTDSLAATPASSYTPSPLPLPSANGQQPAPASQSVPSSVQIQQLRRQLQEQTEQLRRLEALLRQHATPAGTTRSEPVSAAPAANGAASGANAPTAWNGGSRWNPPPRPY